MNVFFKKSLLGLGIFLFAFFLANQILFFEKGLLEKYTTNIVYPFVYAANGVSNFINRCVERKESYEQLKSDFKALREKYEAACDENIKIKATFKFDSDTKELREFKERYNLNNLLMVKVLAKNLKQDGQFFLINKGKNCGIKKNMIGIYKSQLLGKITEVYDYYSKLILITDASCKVAAYASLTKAKGIVIGENKIDLCKMYYVSHISEIQDNDLVLSSGQGLVFPEGFCIGKIKRHSHSHDTLYHDIEIEPIINIKKVKYCLLTDISHTCSLNFESNQDGDGQEENNPKEESKKEEPCTQ